MIESELLLLGLLRESPKHGYEIKTKIKQILSLFAGLDIKSIYYPLRVLEQKGLVAKRSSKSGRRPEKNVYSLTAKGKARFTELLNHSILDFKRPQFSLDLSLYFLPFMKPRAAERRLRARLSILNKLSAELAEMIRVQKDLEPASLIHILEHNLNMLRAESNFISGLLENI